MLVNMHGHVLTQEYEYEIEGRQNKEHTSYLLHMPVDCLKAARLTGLPLLKRHMLFTGL